VEDEWHIEDERNRCSRRNGQADQRTCEMNIRVHGVQAQVKERKGVLKTKSR
jgi:hypothetical protein